MTFKYNWGHWKWYEQIKLNEYYDHAMFYDTVSKKIATSFGYSNQTK